MKPNFIEAVIWRLGYAMDDSNARKDYGNWLERAACRWRGHPAGTRFYNASGSEPDNHCRCCGEDLG